MLALLLMALAVLTGSRQPETRSWLNRAILIQSLNGQNYSARVAAAIKLSPRDVVNFGKDNVFEYAIERLTDDSLETSALLVWALGHYSSGVRQCAAYALGQHGRPWAVVPLAGAIADAQANQSGFKQDAEYLASLYQAMRSCLQSIWKKSRVNVPRGNLAR